MRKHFTPLSHCLTKVKEPTLTLKVFHYLPQEVMLGFSTESITSLNAKKQPVILLLYYYSRLKSITLVFAIMNSQGNLVPKEQTD